MQRFPCPTERTLLLAAQLPASSPTTAAFKDLIPQLDTAIGNIQKILTDIYG